MGSYVLSYPLANREEGMGDGPFFGARKMARRVSTIGRSGGRAFRLLNEVLTGNSARDAAQYSRFRIRLG